MSINKKEKRAALKSALTSRVEAGKLIVLDQLSLPEIKTKEFRKVMEALKLNKALVVLDSVDRNVILSARNIEGVKTTQVGALNTYDVMKYSTVVLTKQAVSDIEEVYA